MKLYCKLTLISFSVILYMSSAKAQIPGITFSQDTLLLLVTGPDSDGNGDSNCNIEMAANNETTNAIPLKWKKRVITNSQPKWEFSVCDENACYLPEIDSAEVILTRPSNYDPYAGMGFFSVSFEDKPNTRYDGYAEVELIISLVNDPDKSKRILFVFDGDTMISSIDEKVSDDISVFPNPSQGIINITGEDISEFSQTVIYDMSGKELLRKSYKENRNIDVTGLVTGSYILAILDNNNNVLGRELISKL